MKQPRHPAQCTQENPPNAPVKVPGELAKIKNYRNWDSQTCCWCSFTRKTQREVRCFVPSKRLRVAKKMSSVIVCGTTVMRHVCKQVFLLATCGSLMSIYIRTSQINPFQASARLVVSDTLLSGFCKNRTDVIPYAFVCFVTPTTL